MAVLGAEVTAPLIDTDKRHIAAILKHAPAAQQESLAKALPHTCVALSAACRGFFFTAYAGGGSP